MTDFDETPVDLEVLRAELDRRAGRVAARVAMRVAATGSPAGSAVRARLARLAIPALAAAAAGIVLLLEARPRTGPIEPFAALVVRPGPARGWIAASRAPDLEEITVMLETGSPR